MKGGIPGKYHVIMQYHHALSSSINVSFSAIVASSPWFNGCYRGVQPEKQREETRNGIMKLRIGASQEV